METQGVFNIVARVLHEDTEAPYDISSLHRWSSASWKYSYPYSIPTGGINLYKNVNKTGYMSFN